jgi:hypothetical protein
MEEVGQEMVVGCNLGAMTEEYANAAEKLLMWLANERAHLDAECTADEVEPQAAWCQAAMRNVLDTTEKKMRICANLKRCWNAEIRERKKAVGREKGGD